MRNRDEWLEVPTIILYIIMSILFITTLDLYMIIVALIILSIISVVIYKRIKNNTRQCAAGGLALTK